MDAQETRIYTAIIITTIVLGVIISYFIVSIVRQQRKNARLHKENILAEITGLEKDRGRIATDLHDELGPILASVKLEMNTFEFPEPEDQQQMEKISNHIDDVIKRMREISFDLMPTSLIRKGLVKAIDKLVNNLNTDSKIKFIFETNSEFISELKLSEEKTINIYRIIQEVIHNVIKHSHATLVNINARLESKQLFIIIADNGIGFDYMKELKENIGFGLRSLISRTQIIGGKMFLESQKGKGTLYTFQIPC